MKLLSDSKWIIPAIALVLFWAFEIYLIQEYTLDPKYPYDEFKWMVSRGIRFVLDFLFCAFLIIFSYRLLLYLIFVVGIVGSVVLTAYYEYFIRSLSLNTIIYQLEEGARVGDFAVQLINGWVVLFLCVGLIIKILLYEKNKKAVSRLRRMLAPGIICLLLYLLIIFGINGFVDPLRKLQMFASLGRMGLTYGYMVTWLGRIVVS